MMKKNEYLTHVLCMWCQVPMVHASNSQLHPPPSLSVANQSCSVVFLKPKMRPKRYQPNKREGGGRVGRSKEEVEVRGRQEWKMKDTTWKPSFFTTVLSKIGGRESSMGKDRKGE